MKPVEDGFMWLEIVSYEMAKIIGNFLTPNETLSDLFKLKIIQMHTPPSATADQDLLFTIQLSQTH